MSDSAPFVVRSSAAYQGHLKCHATHETSGATLVTAAPVDNNGDGSSFSPTDLTGVSLATCMLTTMAIAAERDGIELGDAQIKVEKQMTSTPPRRIARLDCTLTFPAGLEAKAIDRLTRVAEACPVAKSLHPEIALDLRVEQD